MKVDFFIVGAPKSGTTSLYNYLQAHPEICMSINKEPNFFSNEEINKQGLYYNRKCITSYEDYHKLFLNRTESQIIGESSVSYLFYPDIASKLYDYNSNAKIIVLLRNPVERAFSHYLMDYRLGLVDLPFEDILFKKTKHTNLHLYYQQYIELGMYYRQVMRYYSVFNKNNILIINTDDFNKDTLKTLVDVYSFLNVDVNFEPKIDMRYNKYIEANNIFLNKMYSVALLRRFFSQTLPESVISFIKNRFFTKKDKPLLNPKTKSLLYKIFNEETIQLEKLINKKFTSWKN